MKARGERRLTVIRVADLASYSADGDSTRGLGKNLLVLRYGEWLYIQPRGLFFGSDLVGPGLRHDIWARCTENAADSMEAEIIARGLPGAQRTKAWLDKVDKWELDGRELSLEPWVAYVSQLADEVLDRSKRPEAETVARYLLEFALGNAALAEAVHASGLKGLGRSATREVVMRFLDATARAPLPDLPGGLDAASVPALFEHTPWGWDVLAPQPTQ
ncbi:hypothetical protein HMI51_14105 [Corallococcus coralloides]|nr:hypothetical protein [Corallococcus coralloides]